VALILLACGILGLSAWEAFGGPSKFKILKLPGFHELNLETPGLYAGLYQHQGSGPIPVKELMQMNVQLMAKDNYQQIPVLMNSSGQVFDRMGMRGMPLFNFVIQEPGVYDLSAVYAGEAQGPDVSVLLFAQEAQNIKQTLIVGISGFVMFLALGIFLLVKLNHWAPPPPSHL